MKKIISLIAVLLLAGSIARATENPFFVSGATGAEVVLAAGAGTLQARDVLIDIETNATVIVHRAKVSAKASAASTGTTITLPTTATNTIGGVVLTTSDYLIVGTTLLDIAGLAPASATSTVITNTASATVTLGQTVFVCDDGDKISLIATTAWGDATIPYVFTGFNKAPAAFDVPASAAATMVSGRAVTK